MRPITSFARHALAASAVTVFAATGAAADRRDTYLALGDSIPAANGGRERIEIESFHWGTTQAAGKVDALTDGLIVVRNSAARDDHEVEFTTVAGKAPPPPRGVRDSSADVNGDGSAAKKPRTSPKMLAPGATKPTSGSAVGGAVSHYANDGDESESGQATGKRQHKPMRMRSYAEPLDRGSVTVKGSFPGCRVGAAFADAVLQTPSGRYELRDVVISSCPTAASGGLPMESLSLNYTKIEMK